MNIYGSCLCEKIYFSIKKEITIIYHCHCSLCRKQSGTGSNAATLIDQNLFEWTLGQENIHTFKKESGFTSCFCKNCGSSVPNRVENSSLIWVPLGLLNEIPMIKKRLSFCLHSKCNWAPPILADQEYLELPPWSELVRYFNSLK